MENFFESNQCIIERKTEVANRQYYIRKIHNAKTENEDEFFEYYLLNSMHQVLASYYAKLEKLKDGNDVLHIYNGMVTVVASNESRKTRTKEDMKTVSILLMESFADFEQYTTEGKVIVDRIDEEKHYSRFQHACMRFDEESVLKMLCHIGNRGGKQEDIVIKKAKVSKWYHLNGVQNQNGRGERGE